MNNTNTKAVEPVQVGATKPLIIGRAWDNGTDNVSATGVPQPRIKIRLSRDLGIPIIIVAGTELALWPNTLPRREGKQDPDYSVSVQLPTEVVDTEIARQQTAKAQSVPAPAVAQVA